MTLSDFLLARIAEAEADASGIDYDPRVADLPYGSLAPHHPRRLLAECEAKRRIVDLHARNRDAECTSCAEGSYGCGPAGDPDVFRGTEWPCPTIRLFALPYSDHPDYQESWRV